MTKFAAILLKEEARVCLLFSKKYRPFIFLYKMKLYASLRLKEIPV